MLKKTYSNKGFSLVELMIVVMIMAVMTAMAAPYYQTFMASRRLNGAARQVMSDLVAARMQAVSLNRDIQLDFPMDFSNQYIYDSTINAVTKDIQTDYEDVTVKASISPVIFRPDGSASNLSVTVRNSQGERSITISRVGRVKIN